MHEAYDGLAAATKARIEGRRAIHVYQSRYSARKLIALPDGAKVPDSVAHPLVRTHPESGRKALYLNPIRTEGVVDMDDEEGCRCSTGSSTTRRRSGINTGTNGTRATS